MLTFAGILEVAVKLIGSVSLGSILIITVDRICLPDHRQQGFIMAGGKSFIWSVLNDNAWKTSWW